MARFGGFRFGLGTLEQSGVCHWYRQVHGGGYKSPGRGGGNHDGGNSGGKIHPHIMEFSLPHLIFGELENFEVMAGLRCVDPDSTGVHFNSLGCQKTTQHGVEGIVLEPEREG